MDGTAGWSPARQTHCPEQHQIIINKSLAQSSVSSDSSSADIIFIFSLKERGKKKKKPDILRESSEASNGLILPVCASVPHVLLISCPPREYADLITACSPKTLHEEETDTESQQPG